MEDKYLEKKIDDHEDRLRRLEESDVQQRIQLTNIEKSQVDIKLMMSEQTKEQIKQSKEQQQMLNSFTSDMLNYFKEKDNKLENMNGEIKFYNTKQFWVIISLIAGGVLTYFGVK